jgi:hypothetical protein
VRAATFSIAVLALGGALLGACDRRAAQPPPPAPAAPDAASAATVAAPDPSVDATGEPEAVATVGTTAGAPPPPAPPPLPAAAILRSAVALEPGPPGQRVVLAAGAEVVVDPRATFEIELSARTPDARLVLVDGRDDLVAASGTREVAGTTRLTLAPNAPLVPGSRYALRLDGASQRELHDEAGRAFTPLTFPVLAAGTPPPREPKRPAPKRTGKPKRPS